MTERELLDDEPLAINARLAKPKTSITSALIIAASFLAVFTLAWIAVTVIRDQRVRDDGTTETASIDIADTEIPTLTRGDQVDVLIGPSGHAVTVACFLPAPDTPPLIVFVSAAPTDLDLRAEATLIGDANGAYQTVASADAVRPGEQRQAVPRTRLAETVVVAEEIVDCRIDSVEADRQIVRFR